MDGPHLGEPTIPSDMRNWGKVALKVQARRGFSFRSVPVEFVPASSRDRAHAGRLRAARELGG